MLSSFGLVFSTKKLFCQHITRQEYRPQKNHGLLLCLHLSTRHPSGYRKQQVRRLMGGVRPLGFWVSFHLFFTCVCFFLISPFFLLAFLIMFSVFLCFQGGRRAASRAPRSVATPTKVFELCKVNLASLKVANNSR